MEYIDLVYSFFNPYIFPRVKKSMKTIKRFFRNEPSCRGNKLIECLLDAIQDYQYADIETPLFNTIMAKTGKTPAESSMILEEIEKWKRFTESQMAPQYKYLQDLILKDLINQGTLRFPKDPYGFWKFMKDSEVDLEDWDGGISGKSLAQMSPEEFSLDTEYVGYESSFPWLNASYPLGEVPAGQLIIVSACPGTGKTMFCLQEAIHYATHGLKVSFLAMGDTKESDFIDRSITVFSGKPPREAFPQRRQIFTSIMEAIANSGGDLNLSINPANSVRIEEYIDFVIRGGFQVVFIDYDSNFNIDDFDAGDGGMYKYYGNMYGQLTKLTQRGVLVYICCQPKSGTYEQEYFNEGMLGESRRKIEHADTVIGISKVHTSALNIGNISIAKNRRGNLGHRHYIRLSNGHYKIISDYVYTNLKTIQEYKDYTVGEINAMEGGNGNGDLAARNYSVQNTPAAGFAPVKNVFNKK